MIKSLGRRKIETVTIEGKFMLEKMDELIHVEVDGVIKEITIDIYPKLYTNYYTKEIG